MIPNNEDELTPADYKELGRLLTKLCHTLQYRFCIIPEHIQDLCYIGVYGHDGKIIKEANGVDLEQAVNLIKANS